MKMLLHLPALVALALLLPQTPIFAQESASQKSFKAADTNNDGMVSHDELAVHIATLTVSNHDTGKDGHLTMEEAAATKITASAAIDANAAMKTRVIDMDFKKADTDGDGKLSSNEILAKMQKQGITTIFSGIAPENQQGFLPGDWDTLHTSGGIPLLSISF